MIIKNLSMPRPIDYKEYKEESSYLFCYAGPSLPQVLPLRTPHPPALQEEAGGWRSRPELSQHLQTDRPLCRHPLQQDLQFQVQLPPPRAGSRRLLHGLHLLHQLQHPRTGGHDSHAHLHRLAKEHQRCQRRTQNPQFPQLGCRLQKSQMLC